MVVVLSGSMLGRDAHVSSLALLDRLPHWLAGSMAGSLARAGVVCLV